MATQPTPTIYVISDGRGETGLQIVKAALVQFPGQRPRILRRSNLRSTDAVRKVLEDAAERHAIVFYTLVQHDTREVMKTTARELLVPVVDLLGPSVSALHDLLRKNPQARPGLLYAAEREHFDRLDAIDFTLKHDDGQRPHELSKADVVLVGVSRASKSSTCFYLAYAGVCAANVPLVGGIAPSRHLLRLDPERVIGLRVNTMRLITVREERMRSLGSRGTAHYVDKREVAREVLAANKIMDDQGWESFDVSYMAVEEIAKHVMKMRGLDREWARW